MNEEIYMVGGFTGWRQEFIDKLPKVKFDNPIYHNQSSITKLNSSDMGSASTKPCLAYVPEGKRLGTMSYCELGTARAAGMPIISIDENKEKDSILERIASYEFGSKDEAFKFLKNNPPLDSAYNGVSINNKTKNKEPCEKALLYGMFEIFLDNDTYNNGPLTKDYVGLSSRNFSIDSFSRDTDLLVVNFEKGQKHAADGLFLMGLAYYTEVPIILLEGNDVPYPPLLGLARRVMVGPNRFDHLNEYLKNLKSQHIADEALVYYNLMNKFNK